jgi:hypothetical protein
LRGIECQQQGAEDRRPIDNVELRPGKLGRQPAGDALEKPGLTARHHATAKDDVGCRTDEAKPAGHGDRHGRDLVAQRI